MGKTKGSKSHEVSEQTQAWRDFYSKYKDRKPYCDMTGDDRKREIGQLWKGSDENPQNHAE